MHPMHTTLISARQLMALQSNDARLMAFDCTCDLMRPETGPQQYRAAHIPGAVYASLDADLSATHGAPASAGRHPLPSREVFAAWLSSVGFANDMQAVVYDRNGANYCGRLWWMLKWAGHEAVALLDVGLQGWQAEGGAVTDRAEPARLPSNFALGEPLVKLVDTQAVAARLAQSGQTLIDARAPQRYRGEVEPLDPIAGHIPGALNRPFPENLGPDGKFKPAAQLRAEFEALLAGRDPATVVHHCGSGVSAVPNLVAMQIAGFSPTALYAGSWSAWSNTPGLPTRQGAQP
jgi:thiosulfate/3-mercaptopyruvate sulfurtransferase